MKDNIKLDADKIILKMVNNVKMLKRIDNTYTRSDIKTFEKGIEERRADIQFIQYANEFQLFGIMLGVIDKALDQCNNVFGMGSKKADILKKREKVVADAVENIYYLSPMIHDVISNYPSYQLFLKIYESLKGGIIDDCKLEFINAYNIGYYSTKDEDINKIFLNYQIIKNNLTIQKQKNQLKIEKVRRKKTIAKEKTRIKKLEKHF